MVLVLGLSANANAGEILDNSRRYISNERIEGKLLSRDVILNNEINIYGEEYLLPNGIRLSVGYPLMMQQKEKYIMWIYSRYPMLYNFKDGEENEMYEDEEMDGLNGNEVFHKEYSKKGEKT